MNIRFDTPPAGAQQSNGLAVRYAAAKREVPRWRWYLMLLLISLPIFYFATPIVLSVLWRTAPGMVMLQVVTIKAPAEGQIGQMVKEGMVVQAGAALATIQAPRVGTLLPSTLSMGKPLPLNLPPTAAGTASGPGSSSTASSAAMQSADAQGHLLAEAVALAQRDVAFRRTRLDTLEGLLRERAATRAETDSARAALSQASSNLVRARIDLAAHERQRALLARPPLAAATLKEGGNGTHEGRDPLADPLLLDLPPLAVVTSPIAGKVTSVMAVRGENVSAAAELAVVQGDGAGTIEAYISPDDAGLARTGRQATLRFLDGGRIPAEVVEVQTQTGRLPADRVGPLSPRSQAIVVRLRPQTPLPKKYQIHQLPLNVRFDWQAPWQS